MCLCMNLNKLKDLSDVLEVLDRLVSNQLSGQLLDFFGRPKECILGSRGRQLEEGKCDVKLVVAGGRQM